MEPNWIRSVLALVAAHGSPLLLLVSTAENIVLLGMFIPGDAVAVLAGAACAYGALSVLPATVSIAAGVVLGGVVSFGIGVRGGMVLVTRWGMKTGLTRDRVERIHRYFEKHGSKTVFVGCFLSGVKNLVPAVAGASGMRFAPFLVYDVAAAVVRSAGLVALGYLSARSLERAFHLLHVADAWLLGLLGVAVVGWIVVYGLRKRRLARRKGAGPCR